MAATGVGARVAAAGVGTRVAAAGVGARVAGAAAEPFFLRGGGGATVKLTPGVPVGIGFPVRGATVRPLGAGKRGAGVTATVLAAVVPEPRLAARAAAAALRALLREVRLVGAGAAAAVGPPAAAAAGTTAAAAAAPAEPPPPTRPAVGTTAAEGAAAGVAAAAASARLTVLISISKLVVFDLSSIPFVTIGASLRSVSIAVKYASLILFSVAPVLNNASSIASGILVNSSNVFSLVPINTSNFIISSIICFNNFNPEFLIFLASSPITPTTFNLSPSRINPGIRVFIIF